MKREERKKLNEQLKKEVIEQGLTFSQAVKRYDELFGTHYAERMFKN